MSAIHISLLRDQIGYVLQETVLFEGTVRDNIAYGRKGVTDEQILEAAKLANADEFIARMPHGYDTHGRRTRRNAFRRPAPADRNRARDHPQQSDPDSRRTHGGARHRIGAIWSLSALEQLMKGRTVITIAHRLSTIRDADKIIVLKDGVVAEEGTHDELLARGGVYAELYKIQFGAPPASPGMRQ